MIPPNIPKDGKSKALFRLELELAEQKLDRGKKDHRAAVRKYAAKAYDAGATLDDLAFLIRKWQ